MWLTCFSLLVAGVWFSLGTPLISTQYTVKPVLWNLPREHWERVTLDRVCLIWVDDYAWHTIQREIILRSYNTSYFLIEVAVKAGLTVTPMLLKVTLWKIVKWSSYVGFSMDTEVGLWCLFVWLPLTEQCTGVHFFCLISYCWTYAFLINIYKKCIWHHLLIGHVTIVSTFYSAWVNFRVWSTYCAPHAQVRIDVVNRCHHNLITLFTVYM